MISMIVGRCHVGKSYVAVIKYVVSRMKKGAWRKLPRGERKRIMREIIRCHRANRKLYHAVMTGRL